MDHLEISPLGMVLGGLVVSLLVWAPVFVFAYWRRPFGGRAQNYVLAWLSASIGTVGAFAMLSALGR